ALHAHFSGTPLPGFNGTAGDLFLVQIVGLAAQVLTRLALGKRAELAFVGADIGVIDVAGDHEAHAIATLLAAHVICWGTDVCDVVAARLKQPLHLPLREPLSLAGTRY